MTSTGRVTTPQGKRKRASKREGAPVLTGGGEMGERIRAFDWSQTAVGPEREWSPALRTTLRIILANRFPHILWWGPEYIQFYNDAYIPILGAKHPDRALGLPVREGWSEIYHIIGPLIDKPFQGGPPTWDEDILLEIRRHGFPEETHFTIAYSPVPDETAPGGIGGVLATVHEITGKVIGERRVRLLRDLGAHSAEGRTAEESCAIAARTLAGHEKDIPFALIYLIDADRKQASLAGIAGTNAGSAMTPSVISLQPAAEEESDRSRDREEAAEEAEPLAASALHAPSPASWPLTAVLRDENPAIVDDLTALFGEPAPPGPWADPPNTGAVIPIRSNRAHHLAGFLVAGVSTRLRFDEQYRDFLGLVASQIATGIANAREYEEEKKRAEALAEIDRAKTDFFSNVSHEFRTPLTLMLGPLEDLLAQGEGLPAPDRDRIETAHRNSLRLLKLVNTLLDFSRMEAGRTQAVYEPVDLASLTRDLASVFRSAVERAGLRLVIDSPPLPEPVYVDREMWEKIVLNLLSNAFKFTFEGEICVSLRAAPSTVELSVSDTGTGIPPEELPHLFERFHRVRGARGRSFEGSGIGLALVQELARLHGGTVRAESQWDIGSRFIVSIPRGRQHLPADRIGVPRDRQSKAQHAEAYVEEALRTLPGTQPFDATPSAPPSAPTSKARARILIADDNADMRTYVARLLSNAYDVSSAANGADALENIERCGAPDLVLADVMMPSLDGFGMLRELRANPSLRELPVILLSARAGEESRIEGLERGADDYLVKPFSARELLARVETTLSLQRVRREAVENVERASRRLKSALEAAQMTAWEWDLISGEVKHSDNALDVLGLSPDHPIETAFAAVHPQDAARLRGTVDDAIRERGAWLSQFRWIRPDTGELRWMESQGRVLSDVSGAPVRATGVVFDITDRKIAEEMLRENEACLAGQREALESTLNGAPLATALGVLVRTATERLGLGVRAAFYLANSNGAELRHVVGMPDEYAKAVNGFRIGPESLACGLAAHSGEPVITTDVCNEPLWKPWVWLAEKFDYRGCWSFPIHTAAGYFVGTFAVYWRQPRQATVRDREIAALITQSAALIIARHTEAQERKQAENALRESEARFRALVTASSHVVYSMSPDWTEMRHLAGREFIADTREPSRVWLEKYIHPEDQPRVLETIQNAIRTRSIFELEHRVLRVDGSLGWTFSRAAPILDDDGRIVEWFGAARDITEQKEAEENLRQTQRLESLGVLAGGIAHDFNNLLTGMLGNASLLADSLQGSEYRAMTEGLIDASERMARLTQQMLAYSGKGRFYIEPISLSHEVTRIATLVHASIPKHVDLQLELAEVPNIKADASQVQQVVMNLVINAAEAIGLAGGTVKVSTAVEYLNGRRLEGNLFPENERPGPFASLTVRDTGAGMDDATRKRIFDPFFTTKFTGRGLGLSAVLGVVRGHEGLLSVVSSPGQGTTFRVFFPIPVHEPVAPARAADPVRSTDGNGLVLLVDDEDVVLRTAKSALQRAGYQVLTAKDGREAVRLFRERREEIRLVILDLTMPVMGGAEALLGLRQIDPNVLVIGSSGYDRSNAAAYFGEGVATFLQKPYRANALTQKVSMVLRSARINRDTA